MTEAHSCGDDHELLTVAPTTDVEAGEKMSTV